ncbi:MAG: sigma-54 interaction domain-containing protein, partial [Thiogranum sp.]
PDEHCRDQIRMVGTSAVFLKTLEQLNLAALSDAPLLLEGETGTGKDLAANFIHLHSGRHDKPFLTLDCTVLTESLFESEVFGHERGAFTGSVGEKEGLFELVDGGTLFLDEIGEMPASLQSKLLRVLETGEYRRVGGSRIRHTNARIICATNRNLAADVEAGSFREDLYYRTACLHIRIPALRERPRDIPLLAEALLDRIGESTGRVYELVPDAIGELESYSYPGNIRELRNVLSVAAARCTARQISAADISAVIDGMKCRRHKDNNSDTPVAVASAPARAPGKAVSSLNDLEEAHIARLLKQFDGNRRKVATALGISERTMYRKLKRYGLS